MSVNGQKYKAVFRHSQTDLNISPLFAKKKKNLQLTNIKNKESQLQSLSFFERLSNFWLI
jgi:hypothetical protein